MDEYGRVIYDKSFHTKNFLIHYKKLVDTDRLKEDKEAYGRLLDTLPRTLNIDVTKNVLFVGSKDIHKELFLSMFGKCKTLKSYYLCNILNIQDIYMGNAKSDNINITDDERMWSEQDITHDVLCLYIDKTMTVMKNMNVALSLIMSRIGKGKNKLNWVFFRGEVADMMQQNLFKQLYYAYTHEKGFDLIDLNSTRREIQNRQKRTSLTDIY